MDINTNMKNCLVWYDNFTILRLTENNGLFIRLDTIQLIILVQMFKAHLIKYRLMM